MPIYVIGVDPGLRTCGICVLLADPTIPKYRILEATTVGALPSTKKRAVRKSSDNLDRLRIVLAELEQRFRTFRPRVVAVEEFSAPPNASSASQIALLIGGLAQLCRQYQAAYLEMPPKALKKRLTGHVSATKLEVQQAVETLFPETRYLWPYGKRGGTGLIEHASDAVALAAMALESDDMMLALRDYKERA